MQVPESHPPLPLYWKKKSWVDHKIDGNVAGTCGKASVPDRWRGRKKSRGTVTTTERNCVVE
jgi:hypothetical protein